MRTKVLVPALLLAGALVGLAVWLADGWRAPSQPTSLTSAELVVAADTNRVVSRPLKVSSPLYAGEAPPVADSDAATGILADLEKPDQEVRRAALRRARELDDRSIIPRLRELAARTGDAQNKAEIVDTIDFLNLPSIADNMAEAKAARAAAGQPDPPQSLTNRWTGAPLPVKQ